MPRNQRSLRALQVSALLYAVYVLHNEEVPDLYKSRAVKCSDNVDILV
jgi:hypothetical protein